MTSRMVSRVGHDHCSLRSPRQARRLAAVVEKQLVATVAVEIDVHERGQRLRFQVTAGAFMALGVEDHDAPPALRDAEVDADFPSAAPSKAARQSRRFLSGRVESFAAAPRPAWLARWPSRAATSMAWLS